MVWIVYGIIWYLLICYGTFYRYMIVFSGFRQYKCKVEKPLRWMSLQNAYVCQPELSQLTFSFPPWRLKVGMCCVSGGNHSFLSTRCVF